MLGEQEQRAAQILDDAEMFFNRAFVEFCVMPGPLKRPHSEEEDGDEAYKHRRCQDVDKKNARRMHERTNGGSER
jgi:hypothetical protein